MRCYICDKALSEAEIQYIPQTKNFDCCATCLEVAMDAAYCDGFVKEEENELTEEFGDGSVEVLDVDTHRSELDRDDLSSRFQDYDDAGY